MFNPQRGKSDKPLNQLHISYNTHTFYQWSAGSYEPYRCGPFADVAGQPVASIGYPVPTIIKPWYWWVGMIGHTHEWNDVRMTLDEPGWFVVFVGVLALAAALHFVGSWALDKYLPTVPPQLAVHALLVRMGGRTSASIVCLLCLILANRISQMVVPFTAPPVYGIGMYASLHYVLVALLAQLCAVYLYRLPVTAVHFCDFRVSIVFFLLIFTARPFDHALSTVVGHGLHVPVLRALMVWPACLLTQLNVFFHLAKDSPIFTPASAVLFLHMQ
jgi:hypothetical protein